MYEGKTQKGSCREKPSNNQKIVLTNKTRMKRDNISSLVILKVKDEIPWSSHPNVGYAQFIQSMKTISFYLRQYRNTSTLNLKTAGQFQEV